MYSLYIDSLSAWYTQYYIVCNRVYLENYLKRDVDVWYICQNLLKVLLTTFLDINTTDTFFMIS